MCINNFLLMLFLNVFLSVKFYRALQGFKKIPNYFSVYFLQSKIVSDKISTAIKIWKWSILVSCTAREMCYFYFVAYIRWEIYFYSLPPLHWSTDLRGPPQCHVLLFFFFFALMSYWERKSFVVKNKASEND